jgi:hypothetical protein
LIFISCFLRRKMGTVDCDRINEFSLFGVVVGRCIGFLGF